jgi:hypothetical protein
VNTFGGKISTWNSIHFNFTRNPDVLKSQGNLGIFMVFTKLKQNFVQLKYRCRFVLAPEEVLFLSKI